ncbi:S1 RNA-binding domain-containing protein [Prochlorococcus sp. MIT 1306]|uniref:S1 RNA-binding domain-containing protein n=1 Tax=Prochlorococcus sp. MIT 1306 TaxID=1799667 RepID=UPI0007B31C6B|nr:S1 RNA-binding domain-containing protein [Prochlorococcus sp. MIT 1306]KZR62988.1 30S ribosomal protein S1 [Prochlorococcus sp. MIT 1306]
MAGSGSPQPNRPKPPKPAAEAPRKPLQVMHISRRGEQEKLLREAAETTSPGSEATTGSGQLSNAPNRSLSADAASDESRFDLGELQNMTMADLLGPADQSRRSGADPKGNDHRNEEGQSNPARSVDDFDFDEDAFLAALDENEPIGTTGEVATGKVIALESDGVYVDIGGKAPGFMPKNECGLGVITNLKERFPKGLEVEVLVTREQNADGMVTISCRALELRKSWSKVQQMEKEGKVAQVKVNGFNRGGVTCDLEGLRGFIPRSQLQNGENHEALVGKTLGVAFLEVNPETRKLVLSEKRAATAARFSELEVGQLVEGQVVAVKPYGFFIDLGGVSGLLHQSMITGGSLRSLREVFNQGDRVKALITEMDPGRGRIALNTALLEGQPGELLIEKDKVMAEATDRANKARNVLRQQEQSAG